MFAREWPLTPDHGYKQLNKQAAFSLLQAALRAVPAAAARTAGLVLPGARRLPTDSELFSLQGKLGYNFTDVWLLRQALIHPSFGQLNNARCAAAQR